jgi:hypothetical protein
MKKLLTVVFLSMAVGAYAQTGQRDVTAYCQHGATLDDTCFTSAAASGYKLIVPSGTYAIKNTVEFNGLSNLTLECLPGATRFTQTGNNGGVKAPPLHTN